MAQLEALKEMAFILLEETFESRDKGGNVYLDKRTGWFPTLESLSAQDASFALVPGGSTIAAHTHHTTYYLRAVTRDLRGEAQSKLDWEATWRDKVVDESGWDELRAKLKDAYEETVRLLEASDDWGTVEIDVAMAAVTHSSFHLGAVRQFLTALKARAESRH